MVGNGSGLWIDMPQIWPFNLRIYDTVTHANNARAQILHKGVSLQWQDSGGAPMPPPPPTPPPAPSSYRYLCDGGLCVAGQQGLYSNASTSLLCLPHYHRYLWYFVA